MPSNTSFTTATAIAINTTTVQNIGAVSSPTFVYYSFTSGSTQTANVQVTRATTSSGNSWIPNVSIFRNDDLVNPYLDLDGFNILGVNWESPFNIPVAASYTYYVKTGPQSSDDPTQYWINVSLINLTTTATAVADFAVPDDTDGFSLVILDSTTGTTKNIIPFPATETGDIIGGTTHRVMVNGFGPINGQGIQLYTDSFTYVSSPSVSFTISNGALVTSDQAQTFYVIKAPTVVTFTSQITTVNALTGLQGATTWATTLANINALIGVAVKYDNSALYYVQSLAGAQSSVKKVDLTGATTVASSVLVVNVPNYKPHDMLMLSDNTLLVGYQSSTSNTQSIVKLYSTTAVNTTLATYTFSFELFDKFTRATDNPLSFWARFYQVDTTASNVYSGFSKIKNIRVSDGSVLSTVGPITDYGGGAFARANGPGSASYTRYGEAFSCPLFLATTTIPGPPSPSAKLVVLKLAGTNSADVWSFTTSGGLSPSSFTLQNHYIYNTYEEYDNLAAGVYGVFETAQSPFYATAEVSNGDSPDAITLANGDEVIVWFTNITGLYSGIYYIHPLKRNDTVYTNISSVLGSPPTVADTTVVKIPDPFFSL